MIGTSVVYDIRRGDTLIEVARRFGFGFTEVLAANPGVDPWLPRPGTRIVLPAAHLVPDAGLPGILVNLAQQRIFFQARHDDAITTFPIGIGQTGWETPLGRTTIVNKRKNPVWTVPNSLRAERPDLPAALPPGPNNPLGTHALDLEWPGYVIHGTNRPYGVGRRVSHGCIRLYPEDIVRLYQAVNIGTPVTVVDQSVLVAWADGALYLEAHPTQRQADEIEAFGMVVEASGDDDLVYRVKKAAAGRVSEVDWSLVTRTVGQRRGVPVRIIGP